MASGSFMTPIYSRSQIEGGERFLVLGGEKKVGTVLDGREWNSFGGSDHRGGPVTATAGSDVVQSGRHGKCFLPNGQAFVAYPHRPMTLHSPTENSLAVLNHKILEANSQAQNVKLGGHQTCFSINRLWHELCDM
ncbi:hypothetical protein TNCV_1933571 [Trichonephila clavipes]|nr:hypothetical protein TNCV_1933571 [Trichonephila clavipes]